MEIELPSTLTAAYFPGYDADGPAPGQIVLSFGESDIGAIPVTEEQHKRLSVYGFYESDAYRRQELNEIVAKFLRHKWSL